MNKFYLIIFSVAVTVCFYACKKDTKTTPPIINNSPIVGKWEMTIAIDTVRDPRFPLSYSSDSTHYPHSGQYYQFYTDGTGSGYSVKIIDKFNYKIVGSKLNIFNDSHFEQYNYQPEWYPRVSSSQTIRKLNDDLLILHHDTSVVRPLTTELHSITYYFNKVPL